MKPNTASAAYLILAIFSLGGCAMSDSAWDAAVAADTAEGYAQYLHAHPRSAYAEAATDALDWKNADARKTIDAYSGYLAKHPEGLYIRGAREAIENLQWASVATTAGGQVVDPEQNPTEALKLLIGVIRDANASDVRRTYAVDGLERRMLGVVSSNVSKETRIAAGISTAGFSELLVPFAGERTGVPRERLPEVGDLLVELLDDRSEAVRNSAAAAIRTSSQWISPSLIKACSGTLRARRIAVAQLAHDLAFHVGIQHYPRLVETSNSNAIMPCLQRAAKDQDPELRQIGIDSLATARAAFDKWADTLANSIEAEELWIDQETIDAAGFGTALKAAIPRFRRRLADPDFNLRLGAAHIVASVESPDYEGRTALATALWNNFHFSSTPNRVQSFELSEVMATLKGTHAVDYRQRGLIADLGPLAAPAVPLLADIIRTPNPNEPEWDTTATIDCLTWIGPAASSAAPSLVPLLHSPSKRVRVAAAIALAYTSADPSVIPVLQPSVESIYDFDRYHAAVALLLVDPHNPAALKFLSLPSDYNVSLLTLLTAEASRHTSFRDDLIRPAIQSLLIRASLPGSNGK